MIEEMVKNIRFCFRVDKKAGFIESGEGDSFVCLILKNVKSYEIPAEQYEKHKKEMREIIAGQLKCDIELLIPITLNEYLDNTEVEDD